MHGLPPGSHYHQAVVLFRGPKDEASHWSLAIGVMQTGLAWAEGVVKGTEGSEDGDWDGPGSDATERIWSKYNGVGSLERLGLDKWKFSTRRFGDEKTRAVKLTFTLARLPVCSSSPLRVVLWRIFSNTIMQQRYS